MNLNQYAVMTYLQRNGSADVCELRTEFDVKLLHLYPVLRNLEDAGLVERDGDTVIFKDNSNPQASD